MKSPTRDAIEAASLIASGQIQPSSITHEGVREMALGFRRAADAIHNALAAAHDGNEPDWGELERAVGIGEAKS